jgi:hypothetical protein
VPRRRSTASRLSLTTPSGNTITLTYAFSGCCTGGQGGGWHGTESVPGTLYNLIWPGFRDCGPGATGPTAVAWFFGNFAEPPGAAGIQWSYAACNDGTLASGLPCDPSDLPCRSAPSSGTQFQALASGFSCGTPTGFTANGTASCPIFSGAWTLTE